MLRNHSVCSWEVKPRYNHVGISVVISFARAGKGTCPCVRTWWGQQTSQISCSGETAESNRPPCNVFNDKTTPTLSTIIQLTRQPTLSLIWDIIQPAPSQIISASRNAGFRSHLLRWYIYIYHDSWWKKHDERWMNGSRVKTKASMPQHRTHERLARRTIGGWEALPEERNKEKSTSDRHCWCFAGRSSQKLITYISTPV